MNILLYKTGKFVILYHRGFGKDAKMTRSDRTLCEDEARTHMAAGKFDNTESGGFLCVMM